MKKKMAESTFIKILNKKEKNIIRCVYMHPKHEVSDFTNNFITPLLDKLSNENKYIMIMGDFNINLDKCSLNVFCLTTITRTTRNTKTLINNLL